MFADPDYLKIIVTVVLAMFGWVTAHWFTSKRERAAKRREIRVEYLIDAYRFLATEVSHRSLNEERQRKLESIIADIQLFGSAKQVDDAKTLADEIVEKQNFGLDALINDLRDDLREQLGLEPIQGNVKWLRSQDELDAFHAKNGDSDSTPSIGGVGQGSC